MEAGLQQTLRSLTPGILILILIFLLVQPDILITVSAEKILKSIKDKELLFIPAIGLGYLYHVFIRPYLMRGIWHDIDLNIKRKLISLAKDEIPATAVDSLIKSRHLMQIFYGIIDNSASLTVKSKMIRINGFALTTCTDLVFFGIIGDILFAPCVIMLAKADGVEDKLAALTVNFILFTTFLIIGVIFTELFKKRHIRLGDDQLEHIYVNHQAEAKEKISSFVQGLS